MLRGRHAYVYARQAKSTSTPTMHQGQEVRELVPLQADTFITGETSPLITKSCPWCCCLRRQVWPECVARTFDSHMWPLPTGFRDATDSEDRPSSSPRARKTLVCRLGSPSFCYSQSFCFLPLHACFWLPLCQCGCHPCTL